MVSAGLCAMMAGMILPLLLPARCLATHMEGKVVLIYVYQCMCIFPKQNEYSDPAEVTTKQLVLDYILCVFKPHVFYLEPWLVLLTGLCVDLYGLIMYCAWVLREI